MQEALAVQMVQRKQPLRMEQCFLVWNTMSECCDKHEGIAVCVDMGFGHVTFHCWSLGSCVHLSIGLYVQQSCMQVAVETYLVCSAMYNRLHQHSSLCTYFGLLPFHAICMVNLAARFLYKAHCSLSMFLQPHQLSEVRCHLKA